MIRLTIAIAGIAVLLGGCTFGPFAIQRIQRANDAAADLAFKAPCAVPFGAVMRRSVSDRRAAEAMCGGEPMPVPAP